MTYAEFVLIFLVVPLIALACLLRRRLLERRFLALTALVAVVALVYMAPWDHTAAVWGLWTWSTGHTLGIRWWSVPPEEYAFCVLEALLGATLTYALLSRRKRTATSSPASRTRSGSRP